MPPKVPVRPAPSGGVARPWGFSAVITRIIALSFSVVSGMGSITGLRFPLHQKSVANHHLFVTITSYSNGSWPHALV